MIKFDLIEYDDSVEVHYNGQVPIYTHIRYKRVWEKEWTNYDADKLRFPGFDTFERLIFHSHPDTTTRKTRYELQMRHCFSPQDGGACTNWSESKYFTVEEEEV